MWTEMLSNIGFVHRQGSSSAGLSAPTAGDPRLEPCDPGACTSSGGEGPLPVGAGRARPFPSRGQGNSLFEVGTSMRKGTTFRGPAVSADPDSTGNSRQACLLLSYI